MPKFFTFMSTDENGSNSYFHCLIFYEFFTQSDIISDFDIAAAKHREDRIKHEKQKRDFKANISGALDKGDFKFTPRGMDK